MQNATNPSSTDNELSGVAAVSASDAWAVGYYFGTSIAFRTLVKRWNGTAWKG